MLFYKRNKPLVKARMFAGTISQPLISSLHFRNRRSDGRYRDFSDLKCLLLSAVLHYHFPQSVEKHPKAVVSHKSHRGEVQASLFGDRPHLQYPMSKKQPQS